MWHGRTGWGVMVAPWGTLSIPAQGVPRLLDPPPAFLQLRLQPRGSRAVWGLPWGLQAQGTQVAKEGPLQGCRLLL